MLSRSRKTSSFRRRSDEDREPRGFDRSRLPDPRSYYEDIFGPLRPNIEWLGVGQVSVPFRSAPELYRELRPRRLPLPCLRSEWRRHPRVRDGLQRVRLSHRGARSRGLAMTASFPILESAIGYARLGLSVHFQKGKNAFEPGWNSGPAKTEAQLQRDYQAGWNIGFQTGHRSKLNGAPIGVLDPDLRSNDPRHAAEMDAALGELVDGMAPTVRTGSGGSHFYFVMDGKSLPTKTLVLRQSNEEVEWPEDGKTKKGPAWRIEFLWAGHACTLPPSIHPDTGKPYAWVNGGLTNIGPPPDTFLRALRTAESTNNPPPDCWPTREPINAELKPCRRSTPLCFPKHCVRGSWTRRSVCLVRPISSPRPRS